MTDKTDNVRRLGEAKARPNADVVDALEKCLERAKAGEVLGFVLCFQAPVRSTGTCFIIGDADTAHLVCAIERAKLRMLGE